MTTREIQYRVGEGGARVLWYPEDCALEAWGAKYQARTGGGMSDMGFCCIVCGKVTGKKSNTLGVSVTEGGGVIIHRDDIEMEEHTSGFMGWYPVGSECIKVVPEEFRVENPYPVKP